MFAICLRTAACFAASKLSGIALLLFGAKVTHEVSQHDRRRHPSKHKYNVCSSLAPHIGKAIPQNCKNAFAASCSLFSMSFLVSLHQFDTPVYPFALVRDPRAWRPLTIEQEKEWHNHCSKINTGTGQKLSRPENSKEATRYGKLDMGCPICEIKLCLNGGMCEANLEETKLFEEADIPTAMTTTMTIAPMTTTTTSNTNKQTHRMISRPAADTDNVGNAYHGGVDDDSV
jgi:hypothetical protein